MHHKVRKRLSPFVYFDFFILTSSHFCVLFRSVRRVRLNAFDDCVACKFVDDLLSFIV